MRYNSFRYIQMPIFIIGTVISLVLIYTLSFYLSIPVVIAILVFCTVLIYKTSITYISIDDLEQFIEKRRTELGPHDFCRWVSRNIFEIDNRIMLRKIRGKKYVMDLQKAREIFASKIDM